MNIKTHPKHIDIAYVPTTSTYSSTMARFDSILQGKLGVKKNRQTRFSIDLNELNKHDLKVNEIAENVKLKSLSPSEKIDKYFANTPLKNLGKNFEKAQDKYGVNAYFLASIASLESANGTSKIAKDKKNLFGYGAYDDSPYESAVSFATYDDSIDEVARHLSEEYLHENGIYYRGDSIKDVNRNYASDSKWHEKVMKIMDKMSK